MFRNKTNGKIYIGQTIRSIEKRFKAHRQKSSSCVAIYNAIQYHGWDNFEKDWYECPDEDLNFDEELLVREMGTLSPNGYNLKEGGGSKGKMSEETKQKQREAKIGEKNHNYGKTPSEETRRKIRKGNTGKKHSKETKHKIREAKGGVNHHMYGKTHSVDTKTRIGEANTGKKRTEEIKQKYREAKSGERNPNYGKIGEKHHNSKRVYQYDREGKLLGSFGCADEAALHINTKSVSNIRTCALGKLNTACGFKWSYKII